MKKGKKKKIPNMFKGETRKKQQKKPNGHLTTMILIRSNLAIIFFFSFSYLSFVLLLGTGLVVCIKPFARSFAAFIGRLDFSPPVLYLYSFQFQFFLKKTNCAFMNTKEFIILFINFGFNPTKNAKSFLPVV